jgi:hypothetical protein
VWAHRGYSCCERQLLLLEPVRLIDSFVHHFLTMLVQIPSDLTRNAPWASMKLGEWLTAHEMQNDGWVPWKTFDTVHCNESGTASGASVKMFTDSLFKTCSGDARINTFSLSGCSMQPVVLAMKKCFERDDTRAGVTMASAGTNFISFNKFIAMNISHEYMELEVKAYVQGLAKNARNMRRNGKDEDVLVLSIPYRPCNDTTIADWEEWVMTSRINSMSKRPSDPIELDTNSKQIFRNRLQFNILLKREITMANFADKKLKLHFIDVDKALAGNWQQYFNIDRWHLNHAGVCAVLKYCDTRLKKFCSGDR